jgi:hypothetical protein
MVVDLDEIRPSALEQLNCGSAVVGGLHTHPERSLSRRIIENRPSSEDAGSKHTAR